jgi:hypothetical protein
MASLVLSGDTSGSITIAAPAVAGSTTQTLVNVTGTLAPIVSGTAVASTSGTSIEFTSIPSWVKRITVMFSGVSVNAANNIQVQLGTVSGFETTNYFSTSSNTADVVSITTGFAFNDGSATVTSALYSGALVISKIDGNTYVADGCGIRHSSNSGSIAGTKALSAALTQIRVIGSTTGSPTATFNAGTINILYE